VTRDSRRTRALAAGLALLVGFTFGAPPAFAADPVPEPTPAPQPTLVETAEAAIEAMPAATLASAAQAAPEPTSAPSDPSFFKTGKGAAVLVLLAGGLGYTVYSFSHDRVKSPVK
jgi:hypothetical protein